MSIKIPFRFEIGDYAISPAYNEGKIAIFHISGEGGEFSEEDFIKMLEKFYADNF